MVKVDGSKDCYKELGLERSAGENDIRKAFRQRALQYHPDRNPGREQEVVAKFQEIQAAYEVLIDPTQRAKYDAERKKFGRNAPPPQPYTPRRPPAPPRNAYTTTPNGGTFYSRAAPPKPPPPPPPPQRPPPRHSNSFANGADRFTHPNFRAPPTAQRPDSRQKDAEARANVFSAWQKMKQPRAEEPRAYNPNNPNGTPFGRSKSTRTPSDKKGFNPGTPGGDEGQAKSSYRSNFERPVATPPAEDKPFKQFNIPTAEDVPFAEGNRFRTPYSSAKAGERTSMYGDGMGRSASVRNSPTRAHRPTSSTDAGAYSDSGRRQRNSTGGHTPRAPFPHMYDSSDDEEAETFAKHRGPPPPKESPQQQPAWAQGVSGTPQQKSGPTNGTSSNPFKSRSEESINMKFSPSDWHGKFQGQSDYFAPNVKKGAANKGRTSPTRGRPQQRSTAERAPFSAGQSQPPPQASPFSMPPPPPGPPPNGNTAFPNVPESAPHATKFAPEAWAETFKEGSWALPLKTKETSPRRGSTTAKRANPSRKPSVVVDSGAAKQKAKPKYQAFAEDATNGDAMDIDSETPPTAKLGSTPPASAQPFSSRPQSSGTGSVPNGNASAKPSATAAKPTAPGLTGLAGLAAVEPFLPTSNGGLSGLDDLKTQLPFQSQASSAHPTKPNTAQKLKFPTVPRAPQVPKSLDTTSIEVYFTQMENYIHQYRKWSMEITNHLAARDAELDDLDENFIRQRGERTQKLGFASYLQKMKEDEAVLETRKVAHEMHIKALEQCEVVRNKAAKQQQDRCVYGVIGNSPEDVDNKRPLAKAWYQAFGSAIGPPVAPTPISSRTTPTGNQKRAVTDSAMVGNVKSKGLPKVNVVLKARTRANESSINGLMVVKGLGLCDTAVTGRSTSVEPDDWIHPVWTLGMLTLKTNFAFVFLTHARHGVREEMVKGEEGCADVAFLAIASMPFVPCVLNVFSYQPFSAMACKGKRWIWEGKSGMAGPLLDRPMSPRARPGELGNAALQWARCRRGRMFMLSALLIVVVLALGGARNEALSGSYRALSSNYEFPTWRPHLPHLPSYINSPLQPSNASLELENSHIEHVPSHLNKATPNFHLVMPAVDDGPEFCKTTLSAMILNFPSPTIVGLKEKYGSEADVEKARLTGILTYLTSEKVKDEDLMLVVDGKDTWFQLPSDVMIRQYQEVLEDSNKRLMLLYGDQFKQTIVFGATKVCEGEDVACQHVPEPMLPANMYGKRTGKEQRLNRARYLDSAMVMGPVKDLRALYEKAVSIFEEKKSQSATVQSVISTMFGEQQLARKAHRRQYKITQAANMFFDWVDASALPLGEKTKAVEFAPQEGHHYEFSIGLDYTHTLFQPLANCAQDELLQLLHDGSTDLTKHHHDGTPTPPLTIPTALREATPPYWTPDLKAHNPSPNKKPVHIEGLEFQEEIDRLRDRDTPWASTILVQNTYTGAVPAAFHVNDRDDAFPILGLLTDAYGFKHPPSSNISWTSLWYSGYERALLRKYFRNPQSPLGYHNMAIGGDRLWDQRGGQGGVWTAEHGLWYPWGEVDGVCGSLEQIKQVFPDGKGVWLHEGDGVEKSEKDRKKAEEDLVKAIEEKKRKEEEKVKDEAEKAERERLEKEAKEQEVVKQQEEKKKLAEQQEKDRKENEEKSKIEAEQKAKEEEDKAQREKEEREKKEKEERERKEKEEWERMERMEREKAAEAERKKMEELQRIMGDKLTKWQGKAENEYQRR
ncbi:hypothetical protein CC80DRAFT_534913 [Byssothecium circinans]|uniref:J domain-containing protein n=1 Tax=Byssothecium circinans TaxID=147558 RepID=A0A6A5U1N8_9PLEO|nr:hypothetical protein CC80DRAFT_534913 [Byssothecium circinans]